MRKNKLKNLLFILTFCLSGLSAICAQTLSVEKINPNATQIGGVTNVKFSPSGKFAIIQTYEGFYMIPTERLDEITVETVAANFSWTKGSAKDFLPSGKVVFSTERGLYALDAQTGKTQSIHRMTAAEEKTGDYLSDGEMVVVSENLIISGSGDYDIGGIRGRILRFDVRRGRVTRGAQIDGFKNARLSPSGKYVLYEHGNDDAGDADLYDIARNVNYPVPKRFDFKRHFPKYKNINVTPLTWVAADKFVAAIDENQLEEFKAAPNPLDIPDTPAWVALLDAATGKIVWKKQLSFNAPLFLDQLSATKAFFYNEMGRYEMSLVDGKVSKLPDAEGFLFVPSPDKKRVAVLTEKQIFVSALDGKNKEMTFDLPESWQEGSRFGGVQTMDWSPDGKRLLAFDEERLLIIKPEVRK